MSNVRFLIVLSILLTPGLTQAVESATQESEVGEINDFPAISNSVKGLSVHYPSGPWTVESSEMDDRRSLVR